MSLLVISNAPRPQPPFPMDCVPDWYLKCTASLTGISNVLLPRLLFPMYCVLSYSSISPPENLFLHTLFIATITNPYRNVSSGTGIGSERRARYWHECRERRGTKTRVYASLQGGGYKRTGRNPRG